MISLDTETTGVDLRHGAKPFLVTMCDQEGQNRFWEWDVDPFTREPLVVDGDLNEIEQAIQEADLIALQNPKFDFVALDGLEGINGWQWEAWEWGKIRDTLMAGHLLASNQPHDLTTMTLIYLGINIKPLEDAVIKACNEARNICRRKDFIEEHGQWRIASESEEDMPSAGEKNSKYDMWLPRAVAKVLKYAEDHPWWTVTRDYANADSSVTLPLMVEQERRLKDRGLWDIYRQRLKLLPVLYKMEQRGITLSGRRTEELIKKYTEGSVSAEKECLKIAKSFRYDLQLPKGASNNNSLKSFFFDVMKLPVVKRTKRTKGKDGSGGQPSLDKDAMEHYLATLDAAGAPHKFITQLRGKRSRGTAVSYLNGYRRFWQKWIPVCITGPATDAGWYVLHPSLNPTGTATLRFSSSNPNEQNISKKEDFNLRYVFGPAPGREWWSMDAKNIELRIPAYECGERELIDLFEKMDQPPYYGSEHLLNFSTVYPNIWESELRALEEELGSAKAALAAVGPHCKKKYAASWYQWCKNGDFAVGYGAMDKADGTGTADRAFHKPGAHALLKSRFANKEALNQKYIDFANLHGYVETLPDRSVDPDHGYPLLCSRSAYGDISPTVPLNYHVQGTAMWWMQQAMIRCQAYLDKLNGSVRNVEWDGYFMVMQVHDELVFDFPQRYSVKNGQPVYGNLGKIRKIQHLMEQGGEDIGVPTPVGCEYHAVSYSEGATLTL